MIAKMQALQQNSTWESIPLPPGKRQLDFDGFMPLNLATCLVWKN